MISYKELLYQIAGNYLTETPPLELTEEQLIEFIDGNLWDPFEYELAKEVLEFIKNDTKSMISFLESKGIKVLI